MIMRNFRFIAVVLALSGLSLFLAFAVEKPAPTYTVLRTRVPVKVDGKLDDPVWASAPAVGNFVNNADGSPTPLQTEAKILYDDRFLYFGYSCQDENVWATMTKRDEHLWTEEVFEVFLRADLQYKSYIELEVNPLDALIDIYLVDVRKPLHYESWNSEKIAWAVNVDGTVDGKGGDRGWSCELALPMEDIVPAPNIPPKPGDRWMLNLYRVESKPQKAALAWSPTYRNDFHTPDKFGVIIFSDKQVP
jgi:Carbohydrate-binding family 9